jgi:hypothetical protein
MLRVEELIAALSILEAGPLRILNDILKQETEEPSGAVAEENEHDMALGAVQWITWSITVQGNTVPSGTVGLEETPWGRNKVGNSFSSAETPMLEPGITQPGDILKPKIPGEKGMPLKGEVLGGQ